MIVACNQSSTPAQVPAPAAGSSESVENASERARHEMVRTQIERRGVSEPKVLEAMRKVPRHEFVPPSLRERAYEDRPLPIGHDQTISQPYIVALMTELADVKPGDTVLEVGTGSGYQAAVLAEMGVNVFSIEIVEPLAKQSGALLKDLGYDSVTVRHGDGYAGWPEHAPFDAIIVTAAPPSIPQPLKEQLKEGGRLIIPVGNRFQNLLVVTRSPRTWQEREVIPVRFVPMTGKAQER